MTDNKRGRGKDRGRGGPGRMRAADKAARDAEDGKAPAGASNDTGQHVEMSNAAAAPSGTVQEAQAALKSQPSTSSLQRPSPTVGADQTSQVSTPRASNSPAIRGAFTKRPLAPVAGRRRRKEDRDAILRAEEAKTRQNVADQEREKQRQDRLASFRRGFSSQKRGQGRGGYMGVGTGMGMRQASGPFSLGSIPSAKTTKPWSSTRIDGLYAKKPSGRKGKVKDEARGGEAGAAGSSGDAWMKDEHVKGEDGYYISSDYDEDDDDDYDAEDGPRRDIDLINLLSSDEEDMAQASLGLVPIRIKRDEHRDRTIAPSPPPKLPSTRLTSQPPLVEGEDEPAVVPGQRKGKQRAKDVEITESRHRWRGAYDDEELQPPVIKHEPNEDVDMAGVDPAVDAAANATVLPLPADATKKKKAKSRQRSVLRHHSAFATAEDEAEALRKQEDMETLREHLGHIDTDEPMNGTEFQSKTETVYLFQFPPVLPDLILASDKVKAEANDDDVVMGAENVDLTVSDDKDKGKATDRNVEVKVEIKPDPDAPPKQPMPKLASGAIGKLRVHASGKVSFSWGGTDMALHMGMQVGFLQDAVITRTPTASDGEGATGEAWALGPVKGKFVLTPDWDEILR